MSAPATPTPAVDLTTSTVAFAGDWHGDTQWGTARLMSWGERGIRVVLHVGDLGIWPGPPGKKFLTSLHNALARYGMVLMVTPGNHEDWPRIDAKKPEDRGDGWGSVKWLTAHIAVLPRAHRFALRTPAGTLRTFVSLGGAPSVDFDWRTPGRNWFPTEAITDADVAATINGGHADIMLAHDSPDAPHAIAGVQDILRSNPMGFSQRGLDYATEGRQRMHQAFEAVAPALFVHGHYHVTGERLTDVHGRACRVVGLHQQRHSGNVMLVDLDADLHASN